MSVKGRKEGRAIRPQSDFAHCEVYLDNGLIVVEQFDDRIGTSYVLNGQSTVPESRRENSRGARCMHWTDVIYLPLGAVTFDKGLHLRVRTCNYNAIKWKRLAHSKNNIKLTQSSSADFKDGLGILGLVQFATVVAAAFSTIAHEAGGHGKA